MRVHPRGWEMKGKSLEGGKGKIQGAPGREDWRVYTLEGGIHSFMQRPVLPSFGRVKTNVDR